MTSPDFYAGPVRRADEATHYRGVKNFAYNRWQASRRTNWLLTVIVILTLSITLMNASLLRALFPLVRHDPVYFGVLEDGSIDTALTDKDMTDTEREAVLKEQAWTYVKVCESYSYADAWDYFNSCRDMSDAPVWQSFYSKWFLSNGKDAPESPQKLFGQKGQIDIREIGRPVFIRDHVIQVKFKRIAWRYDDPQPSPNQSAWSCKPPSCTAWTATIDYTLLDTLPNGAAHTHNPLKFWATRYQINEGAN